MNCRVDQTTIKTLFPMEISKSLFVLWLALGLISGIGFGLAISSMAVGLPIGLVLSLLTGIVFERVKEFNGWAK